MSIEELGQVQTKEIKTSLPKDPSSVDVVDIAQAIEDIKATISKNVVATPTSAVVASRRPQSSVLSYGVRRSLNGRSDSYRSPFHDYSEIARAIDTESYLARSVQKHREYILKEDWEITGKNPEIVEYVKERLFQISLATGLSTKEWVRELVTNLVSFSTAFLVMKRDVNKSLGRRIRLHGKKLDPIAGLFPMDPVSVKVSQNNSGRPVKWRQEIDGRVKTFSADDVLDITIDRKSGFTFGTPYSVTVLDDIRALRRLEELIEMVAHKHLFPMFHVTIGTEKSPAQDIETSSGSIVSEVELARGQIQEVPAEGGLVTSERYKFELIGAEGEVLDLSTYLMHFKDRVMSGLRLSPLDLGQADTGNKATAQVVNRNLVDAVKDFQRVISDQITLKLLDVLVLEGGYDLTRLNRVHFSFPTADREEERSQQQHGLSMFQGNAITCSELRQEYLRKDDLTDEQKADTFFELFEMKTLDKQLIAKATEQTSSTPSESSKDATSVKVRPVNQFGVSGSKPTFPINDIITQWQALRSDCANSPDSIHDLLKVFVDTCPSLIHNVIYDSFTSGLSGTSRSGLSNEFQIDSFSFGSIFQIRLQDNLKKLLDQTIIMLEPLKNDRVGILSTFDAMEIHLRVKIDRECRAARNLGYMKAATLYKKSVYSMNGDLIDLTSSRDELLPHLYNQLIVTEDSETPNA